MNPPIALHAGDTLLYSASDFFGRVTSFRTWSPVVHVEKFEGNGKSLASRNGLGVARYDLRLSDLAAVLRPVRPINMAAVKKWFDRKFDGRVGVTGRPYGWLDLLRFYGIRLPTNGWICSQTVALIDRVGDFQSFAGQYYCGTIDPGDFFITPAYQWAWVRRDVLEKITR